MNINDLNHIQLDALREVSNIGSGNAATALSVLIGEKVDMSVPSVNFTPMEELVGENAERHVVAVMVKVIGDIPGSTMYVFDKNIAVNLIEVLTGNRDEELTEFGLSAISEVGNIIAGSFINAIASFIGVEAVASVPAVAEDMAGAILVSSFVENGQYDDKVIDIQTIFKGSLDSGIEGDFFYIPEPGSLNIILKSLGFN